MAVLIEAFSIVIRREAIESRFKGGMQAFDRSIPTSAVCADDHLIRVGFMDSTDVRAYIESLEAAGMKFCHEDLAIDLAVIDQNTGPTTSAPWLEFKKIETDGMKLSICWLAGKALYRVAIPRGWTYERSLSATGTHIKNKAVIGDRLKFLRRENGVEVYLDLQTNKEIYSARPQISGDTPTALQTQITAMVHEALAIERKGVVPRPKLLSRVDPRYTRLNTELLPEIERIVSGPGKQMMAAHFAQGVILRLLGRLPEAEGAFRRARELAPGNIGVLRDLVRCIAEQRRPRDALPFAREAAGLDSSDETVLGNLAACLMQCGEDAESLQVIARALEINPEDKINLHMREALLKRKGKR